MSTNFQLRPAGSGDAVAIRRLIREAGINPFGLHWQRFVLAVDEQGDMVGCGQVKPHGDGSRELASIAVEPAWRGRGVARAIIQHLIVAHPGTLYLTCRAPLASFYKRFGFEPISGADLPPYFRRLRPWIRLFGAIVMRRG